MKQQIHFETIWSRYCCDWEVCFQNFWQYFNAYGRPMKRSRLHIALAQHMVVQAMNICQEENLWSSHVDNRQSNENSNFIWFWSGITTVSVVSKNIWIRIYIELQLFLMMIQYLLLLSFCDEIFTLETLSEKFYFNIEMCASFNWHDVII